MPKVRNRVEGTLDSSVPTLRRGNLKGANAGTPFYFGSDDLGMRNTCSLRYRPRYPLHKDLDGNVRFLQ